MPARKRRTAMVLALPLGLVASAALVYQSSSAAFTASTATAQESWTAGTVVLTDNSATSLPWTAVAGLKPGATDTKCVVVDYTGSLNANIALYVTGYGVTYATDDANDLEDYLQFTVKGVDGNHGDSAGACDGTVAGATQLLSPVITGVTANTLHSTYTNFTNGSKTGTVTAGAPHHYVTYQITYTVDAAAGNGAQGDNVKLNFQWEAQNV